MNRLISRASFFTGSTGLTKLVSRASFFEDVDAGGATTEVAISATGIGVATITEELVLPVQIDAIALGVADMSKSVGKFINPVAIGIPKINKGMSVTIQAIAMGIADLTKSITKEIAVVAIGIPLVLGSIVINKSISATATGVASVIENVIIVVGKPTNVIFNIFKGIFTNPFKRITPEDD